MTGPRLVVVIPSWSPDRALALIRNLRTDYATERYLVVGCARPLSITDLEWAATDWIETRLPLSPVEAMALGAQKAARRWGYDVLAFLHDDVQLDFYPESWNADIYGLLYERSRCGLLGFGGSLGFATDDIYRAPYDYRQLARVDFISNMREAESHGRRVRVATQVAALDGFSLVVTREFYEASGGWESCLRDGVPFHMYDAWISCRAAELGFETWMLPLRCHHEGGQTSVTMQERYAEVVRRLGYASAEDLYAKGHKAVYKRFVSVLPIRLPRGERK